MTGPRTSETFQEKMAAYLADQKLKPAEQRRPAAPPPISVKADRQKLCWVAGEIPGLIRMLRREYDSRVVDGCDGLVTLRRVNLLSMVRAVVNQLQATHDVQLHINPAMGCEYGSIRFVYEGKSFWTLPVPDAICKDVMDTFATLAQLDGDGSHDEHIIDWRWGDRHAKLKVLKKPAGDHGNRLAVWVGTTHRD